MLTLVFGHAVARYPDLRCYLGTAEPLLSALNSDVAHIRRVAGRASTRMLGNFDEVRRVKRVFPLALVFAFLLFAGEPAFSHL